MIPATLRLSMIIAGSVLVEHAMSQPLAESQKLCLSHTVAIQNAKEARLSKNPEKALAIVEPLLKKLPDCFNLNYSFGLSLTEKGDFRSALTYLKKAQEIRERDNVNDYTIYNSLGWAYMLSGDYVRAEEIFKKTASGEIWSKLSNDTRKRVLNNSGLLYIYMGRYQDAERTLKLASTEYGSPLAADNLRRLSEIRKRADMRKEK